jgi:hypothetical protein
MRLLLLYTCIELALKEPLVPGGFSNFNDMDKKIPSKIAKYKDDTVQKTH